MRKKRTAPPVATGYDPRSVERAPRFTDGHLPADAVPFSPDSARPGTREDGISPPTAPDGISGDWS